MTDNERRIRLELIDLKKRVAALSNDEESLHDLNVEEEAIYNGYVSFYNDKMPEEKSEEWINQILDILEMYSYMINSISNNQKPPYKHTLSDVKFPGFDGNNEVEELGFVNYFLKLLNRYSEISMLNDDFNSHMRMKPKYLRMLTLFNEMGKPVHMTDNEIDRLLNA